MIYDVSDIANYFIWRANTHEEFGENMTNLRLQKLVYYAQGFNLAWYGRPLFLQPLEASAHGPVVRELYCHYQQFGAQPLPTPAGFDAASIDDQTRGLLEEVFQVYGQYSAWGLRNLSHEETPWKDTPRNEIIPPGLMGTFFAEQLTVG